MLISIKIENLLIVNINTYNNVDTLNVSKLIFVISKYMFWVFTNLCTDNYFNIHLKMNLYAISYPLFLVVIYEFM